VRQKYKRMRLRDKTSSMEYISVSFIVNGIIGFRMNVVVVDPVILFVV